MKALLLAFALLAQNGKPNYTSPNETPKLRVLGPVALNGAAGTRTFIDKNLKGLPYVSYYIFFDYTAQAGTISIACTPTDNDGTTLYLPTICASVSGNTCTLATPAAVTATTPSLSADTYFKVDFKIRNVQELSCVVTHGGTPGATDKITVDRMATVQ